MLRKGKESSEGNGINRVANGADARNRQRKGTPLTVAERLSWSRLGVPAVLDGPQEPGCQPAFHGTAGGIEAVSV